MMDCYELLEIPANASLKDINSAYKRLALKHHPDKTSGNDAAIRFQKINEAVEVLRDPTSRAVHDRELGHRNKVRSEEELLFASPDYTGWKPNGMERGSYRRENRYKFSYAQSVHMDPNSAESREELARCKKEREEEKGRRENLRRAAEESVECEQQETESHQRWRFIFNPQANPFEEPEQHEEETRSTYISLNPEAEPFKRSENLEDEIESTYSSLNPEAAPFGETEVSGVYSPSEPVWWAGAEPTGEQQELSAAGTGNDNNLVDMLKLDLISLTSISMTPLSNSQRKSKPASNENINVDSTAASVFMASSRQPMAKTLPKSSENFAKGDVSGAWPLTPSHHRTTAYPESMRSPDQESAPSVYYDFSDAESQQSESKNIDADHGSYHESLLNAAPSDASTTPLWYDLAEFDESSLYPYLCPFVPYFKDKLAETRGLYTRDDLHGELKGMIMETYCGWLETLRATIPGVQIPANTCNSRQCRHLGYWKKGFGQEACEQCKLWQPIYTLVCPGCGIRRCVRCKFEENRPYG